MPKTSSGHTGTYLLACNGAPIPASWKRTRANQSACRDLATFGPTKNVVLKISDITDRAVAKLPPAVVDLLELAALVYAADQCCERTPGRRFDYGRKWRRFMQFEVAVRCPDFWSTPKVQETLTKTLHFLSEDEYEFNFHRATQSPALPEYLEYGAGAEEPKAIEQVMLMSGGLDSLAGAVEQVVHRKRHVAMVCHKPVEHLAARQRSLIGKVGERSGGGSLRPFHVPVTAHKLGLAAEDFTQRSRSFLYVCLGAAVAHLVGLLEVWFYENGVTSVNLPLCAQEIGGRATRTTHPQVLHGFGEILSLVFDNDFKAINGFFWQTKCDVLKILQRHHQQDLAPLSVSCSHTRQITHSSPHCGMCSQCLSRRIAALGAEYGVNDPFDGYRKDPLAGERILDDERILAERFIGQARDVSRMKTKDEFNRKYAGELARVYPYLNMLPTMAAEKLFDLHLRHAREVSNTVVAQIARYSNEFWDGDLCETCAVAYAYGIAPLSDRRKRRRKGAAQDSNGDADTELGATVEKLILDEETFTVTLGAKRFTFVSRNKQQFDLLARLFRRPGTRVLFDQLREKGDVWSNYSATDGTIRGAVARLRQTLDDAGMSALSKMIHTGTYQGRAFVIGSFPAEG